MKFYNFCYLGQSFKNINFGFWKKFNRMKQEGNKGAMAFLTQQSQLRNKKATEEARNAYKTEQETSGTSSMDLRNKIRHEMTSQNRALKDANVGSGYQLSAYNDAKRLALSNKPTNPTGMNAVQKYKFQKLYDKLGDESTYYSIH